MSARDVPNDIESLRRYLAGHPEHQPVTPRGPGLGLGGRPGAAASTSAMRAIGDLGIEASAIQCSVFRELRPEFFGAQDTLVEYKGIGRVPVGHTGMTIRGNFLAGMQDRIRRGLEAPFVADADHIPLRGDADEDIEEFRRFIDESRDRTFFTVDPHFCMDTFAASPADKFRSVMPALERAASVIGEIKGDAPYVIELSVDEAPGITSAAEMAFLARRLAGGRIPLFSVAPAIGFSKKDDDTDAMRLTLESVLPDLSRIARDHGWVLGIHSGDGKRRETLLTIGELTGGGIWYKVSPDRQRLFFRLMADSPDGSDERDLFEQMYRRLLDMVRKGIESPDAEFASNCRMCLDELEKSGISRPVSDNRMFYDFGFLLVREFKPRLDNLSESFLQRYFKADGDYIRDLALHLGLPRP